MSWCGIPIVYLKRAHQENTVEYIDSLIAAGFQRPLTRDEQNTVLHEAFRLRRNEKNREAIGPYTPAETDTLLASWNCLDRFVDMLEALRTITGTTNLQLVPDRSPLLTQVHQTKSHLSAMMEAIAARNSHTTDTEGPTP